MSTSQSQEERLAVLSSHKKTRKPRVVLPASHDPEALLSATQVRMHMGGVTRMTLYRWTKAGTFPKADVRIGQSDYWQRKTVTAHVDAQKARSRSPSDQKDDANTAGIATSRRPSTGGATQDPTSAAVRG